MGTRDLNAKLRAFTVAQGLGRGLGRGVIDGGAYARPFHGVRVPAHQGAGQEAPIASDVLTRVAHYRPRLAPGQLFSHTTALRLHGCPIRGDQVLHVASVMPHQPPRTAGVTGHRLQAAIACGCDGVVARDRSSVAALTANPQVPHVAPLQALLLSGQLLDLEDLVVAIDHLVLPRGRVHEAIVPLAELVAAAAASSWRGITRVREALALAAVGAESRMETLLRLRLRAAGVTGLALQFTVRDAQGFVGRFDLADPHRRRLYEYDGEQHRLDRVQYLKDLRRIERARDAGWKVLRFHYEDLFGGPARVAERIAGD